MQCTSNNRWWMQVPKSESQCCKAINEWIYSAYIPSDWPLSSITGVVKVSASQIRLCTSKGDSFISNLKYWGLAQRKCCRVGILAWSRGERDEGKMYYSRAWIECADNVASHNEFRAGTERLKSCVSSLPDYPISFPLPMQVMDHQSATKEPFGGGPMTSCTFRGVPRWLHGACTF